MLFENDRFFIAVGELKSRKDGPCYLVTSKATNVVEFSDTVFLFVRQWAIQMQDALDEQDEEIANPKPITIVEGPSGDSRPN